MKTYSWRVSLSLLTDSFERLLTLELRGQKEFAHDELETGRGWGGRETDSETLIHQGAIQFSK